MHIAINAFFWNRPDTGSGQYTRHLVYYLNRLVSDLRLTLVYPLGMGELERVPPSVRVKGVVSRPGHLGKVIFEQITFPRTCQEIGADLAHVPYWGPSLRSSVPQIVTIHDIITMLFREYRQGLKARLYNALVAAGARGANHVITDSKASQADIIKHLSIPPEKVTSIYLAADSQYKPDSEFLLDMAILQKYDLPDFYVLTFGGFPLHKNLNTLLLAYTYVAQALGDEYPLILAGKKPEPNPPVFPDYDSYIRKLGLTDKVKWIGFVDETDKPAVYRGAMCFAYPSRYEGFGLSPLEAMASGVPVVTTSASSIPEVVGDAAFAVEPDDERDMAGAIIATLIQDNLAKELKEKGLRQAATFSWENTVHETLLVYDSVLS